MKQTTFLTRTHNHVFLLFSLSLSFFPRKKLSFVGSSYHQNNNRRSARYPDRDREKDRLDRLERDRERVHVRERDVAIGYDDELNDQHYGGGGTRDEYQMHRDERRAIDRDPRNRDPRVERVRTHVDVGSNSRHLVNNSSNYDDSVDLIREKEKERFAHRREREADYSPHRGNRRVLNANAM
jgi:hypothetical protein